MGRSNSEFHAGHGFGYEPKIGPTLQPLRTPKTKTHWLPNEARYAVNEHRPTETRLVKISSIRSGQRDVQAKKVQEFTKIPAEQHEPVSLWRDGTGMRLYDGNHRIAAAVARGETHIMANIWDNPWKRTRTRNSANGA